MAKQTINDGETGLSVRTKLNENFTEVYATADSAIQPDATKELTAGFSTQEVALTDATTVTPDLTLANIFTWAMGAARTLGNPVDTGAGVWYIYITPGGEYGLTLDTNYNLVSGAFDSTTSVVNILTIVSNGSGQYDVFISQRP